MNNILVIDDDEEIRKLIKDFLQKENYNVDTAKNGSSALKIMAENPGKHQLAVLDLMLPDISGTDVCMEIRKFSNIPILMLTAKSEDVDKIVGLEVGADDYVTKPFNPKELVARIKAILRRSHTKSVAGNLQIQTGPEQDKQPPQIITIFFKREKEHKIRDTGSKTGSKIHNIKNIKEKITLKKEKDIGKMMKLEIHPQARKVFVNDQEIRLTNKEFNMLVYLAENTNIAISREKLLENIWGYDFIGESRTIDVHIKELRKKIGDVNGNLIETIWSVGYRLTQ